MLSDWDSHSEVIIWKIRTHSFVAKDNIYSDDSILWVLSTLK